MKIFKVFISSCIALCLWGNPLNQSIQATEQDEYIISFVKSVTYPTASLVSYENGQLTIKNTPWDPLAKTISSIVAACGGAAVVSGFMVKNKDTQALLFLLGSLTAIVGGIAAISNGNPGDYILTFDDKGLSLNGYRHLRWADVDSMGIDIVTTCGQYGIISEEKNFKFFDRFKNQLFSISNDKAIGVDFDNVIALIKHYHQKATDRIVIPIENKTTVQKQRQQVIYMPTYNYH